MVCAFDATGRETADVVAVAADDGLVAMFTATGIVLLLAFSFLAAWANEKDRAGYGRLTDEEARKTLLLHISRDLQLIVYLLCGIIVMLGIVADRPDFSSWWRFAAIRIG